MYFAGFFKDKRNSGFESALLTFSDLILSGELWFAEAETSGWSIILDRAAMMVVRYTDRYAPATIKPTLFFIAARLLEYSRGLFEASRQIDAQKDKFDVRNDIDKSKFIYLSEKLIQGKNLIKTHATELALNLAFSIVVGQLWSVAPGDRVRQPIKIFFTTLAAGAFVHYGLYEIRKFKEYLATIIEEALEPFHDLADKEEEEIQAV